MTNTEPAARGGLIERVRGLLVRPSAEWNVIDREPATVGRLFTGYACILALIPPIAIVVRGLAFVRWGATFILLDAFLTYVISLGGAFLVGLIIEALAPTFGGQKSRVQAMKLSVYSSTPAWIGGVFNIVPILGGLLALAAAIYGLYVLYRGMPKLMRSPQDKTAVYFATTVICAVLIYALLAWVVALVTAPFLITSALVGGAY